MLVSVIGACFEHAFFDAPFGDEAVLHGFEQALEHDAGLMEQGDAEVGNLLIVHLADMLGIGALDAFRAGIGAHGFVARVERSPLLKMASAEVVFIVVEEFLETRLCHIGELDFRLARRGSRLIALGNILLARARRLNHLVNGAVALGEVAMSEVIGDVVDDFRHLIKRAGCGNGRGWGER